MDVRRSLSLGLCALGAVLLGGCASGPRSATPAVRPQVLTVPQLTTMVQNGEAIGVILGRIDGSGTVYRLSTEQRADLRANGMPAGVLSRMELTYQRAIAKNPDLAKSDKQWIQIGDYWYGGLPAGWPRDWVVGAPEAGQLLR